MDWPIVQICEKIYHQILTSVWARRQQYRINLQLETCKVMQAELCHTEVGVQEDTGSRSLRQMYLACTVAPNWKSSRQLHVFLWMKSKEWSIVHTQNIGTAFVFVVYRRGDENEGEFQKSTFYFMVFVSRLSSTAKDRARFSSEPNYWNLCLIGAAR